MSENTTNTTGPWGPYHDRLEQGLAHCADYLGRLQRSLAGEIAPDRHYFLTKAAALRDASAALLRRARDVQRWLGTCDASYGPDDDLRPCARPAGHAGAHDDRPSPAERLDERATALAALAAEVADGLAWATLAIDAGDDGPDVAEALGAAARRLGELARGAANLAAEVTALATGRSG